jgi:hypothetical protein
VATQPAIGKVLNDSGLQKGDFIAVGVGIFSGIVITLLVVYILFLHIGCRCGVCKATAKQKNKSTSQAPARPNLNPYTNGSLPRPVSEGSLGSLSEKQLWPEKKVLRAPSIQRPRLNLHYYPESHPDWDVTQM